MSEPRLDGLQRIGSGRQAEVFAWEQDRVLRLARTPALGASIEIERAALDLAGRCGVPVPRVYEQVEVDGRPGLVLERLDARDALSSVLARPWELATMPAMLARVHASLHEIEAPPELPDVKAMVASRLSSPLVPARLGVAARRALGRLPEGRQLCHGDFHPGNVLRRRDGGYALIDWGKASRGDPAADVALTRLLIVGAWIPGLGPWVAQLPLSPARRALYVSYRLAYARRRHVAHDAIAAWLAVMAVARLADDIRPERPRLLALAWRSLLR